MGVMYGGVPNLRESLQRARELGCIVEERHRTGEVKVRHPSIGKIQIVSGRRKDTPRHLLLMLNRLEEAQRRPVPVDPDAVPIGTLPQGHDRMSLTTRLEHGERMAYIDESSSLVHRVAARVVEEERARADVPPVVIVKAATVGPTERPNTRIVEEPEMPPILPLPQTADARARRYGYKPELDTRIREHFRKVPWHRGAATALYHIIVSDAPELMTDRTTAVRIPMEAFGYHVRTVIGDGVANLATATTTADAALLQRVERAERITARYGDALEVGMRITHHIHRLIANGDADALRTIAAALDVK